MQGQRAAYVEGDIIPGHETAHRVGGAASLALRPHEASLDPPGISVLLGGTPGLAASDMRRVFGPRSTLGRLASVVGTARVDEIRRAGFDVIPKPTGNFPNHGRMVHPTQAAAGFTPDNLDGVAKIMQDTGGL
jgi:hypothetical protein